MATPVREIRRPVRGTVLTWGRCGCLFAFSAIISTASSLFAPYFTSRMTPYICFSTSIVVSYAMVLLGILQAMLGMIFDPKDRLASRALSMNLFAAALPLVAFVIFVALHH